MTTSQLVDRAPRVTVVGVLLACRAAHKPRRSAATLDFPHDQHREVNCLVCHHNMVDHAGIASCIACHRKNRCAEATFYVFCADCHGRLASEGHKHGPTRS
jgi:hypothetical protein